MFCRNCGKENPEDAVFCKECGAKLVLAPGETNTVNNQNNINASDITKAFIGKFKTLLKKALAGIAYKC